MKQRLIAYAAILGLVLLGTAQAWAADVTLVPKGAVWKYLDQGSNQGTAWRETVFDDTGWARTTLPLSAHAQTNIDTIGKFLPTRIRTTAEIGRRCTIEVGG